MSEQTSQLIAAKADRASGVGTIVLQRESSLNAFNLQLAEQVLAAMERFENDREIRVIVVRGAGRAFSAGGDVAEMHGDVVKGEDRAAYFRSPLQAFNRVALAIRRSEKPVVAAVHGAVAGVAFNLMLACDLRLAEENTRFAQAFIRIGLSPDGGGTYVLPRLVGHARACELAMLPTQIDARKAVEWGLVNWAVSADAFEQKLDEITAALARGPALAIARTKALMNRAEELALSEHMERERLAQVENAASEDFGEGLAAFLEKRPPNFQGK